MASGECKTASEFALVTQVQLRGVATGSVRGSSLLGVKPKFNVNTPYVGTVLVQG